jgi:uracil-DNA glycosylase
MKKLEILHKEIIVCRRCKRLVRWREKVAREKRAAFKDWTYWGRPLPGFGDVNARIVVLGLAPAAHGGNRTGRFFTGDRSGDFLFAALHRGGWANQAERANQAESVSRDDGLTLKDVFVTAPVRCAPPDNAPLPSEIKKCSSFLDRELALLPNKKVVLALGIIAWRAWLDVLARGGTKYKPLPKFAHGAELPGPVTMIGSFHVSAQNTLTGKLTPAMFDTILDRVRVLAGA